MAAKKRIRPKRTPEQNRKYENNRKAKIAALSAEEQAERKQKQVEYDKQYYEKNRGKILARKRIYQVENREEITKKKLQYADLNRDKVRQISAACAHRRRAAEGYLSVGDIRRIKEAADNICAYCTEPAECLELEHCIPLSRGGTHSDTNCLYACRKCNRTKSDKSVLEFLFSWPRTTHKYK